MLARVMMPWSIFKSFESFLTRLNIYKGIPSTTEMTEIIKKILIELLSTIAVAIKQVKDGRLSEPRLFDKKFQQHNASQ
jgi:hypothetical protein